MIILLGPPGSGKSTIAETLLRDFGLMHFAVRRALLLEKQDKTDIWFAASDSQSRGEWIPDDVVIRMFARHLRSWPGLRGGLVEGLPANAAQARMVMKVLADQGRNVDVVLQLDVPDKICMERMRGRQVCFTCDGGISQAHLEVGRPEVCARCGSPVTRRPDDYDVPFAERLRLHRSHINGILDKLGQERLVVIDGNRDPETVLRSTMFQLARRGIKSHAESGQ